MDIVKFTIDPRNEEEREALLKEIREHGALSEAEKQQLTEELKELVPEAAP
ncbi:hypothetical protein [Paenibacillus oleatilyticus]|uniref:hypothetical protein n=1 Tax=Paenibacillus oleatilyticus TaxID=2594886 RepID=UPI001C1FEE4C|nr:hypothetical protein [Paenibacillus oleatilyticus]MBU7317417.1 hypothetical protein [Paenibacillus oleatilyticus]